MVTHSFIILATLIIFATALPRYTQQNSIKNYELVRPLQYYFYLLQMKSQFNPMLGGLISIGDQCSSKAGPFCRLTGHEPFQTHALRTDLMKPEDKAIYDVLMQQQKQVFQFYDSVVKDQHSVFVIRNDYANKYEQILKTAIGDRMHTANMLPPQLFQTLV